MDVKFASHLPILRRDARKEQDHKRGTRWDDYSGEPTMDSSGKTAQVDPGNAPFTAKPGSSGHSSRVLNWGREQLHSKKKLAEVRHQASGGREDDAQPIREPRESSSGRPPTTGSYYDEKPRSRSRSTSRFQVFKPSSGSREDEAGRNDLPDTTDSLQPRVLTTITANPQEKEKPSVLKKNRLRGRAPGSNEFASSLPGKRRDSSPPRIQLPEHGLDSSMTGLKLASSDAAIADKDKPEPYNLPPSRSGAMSNYTLSEEGTATRASTPRSVSESVDTSRNPSDGNFASVMSRKRPIPTGGVPQKKPTRKPTPTQAVREAAARGMSSEPATEQPKNHIEALEQRQESLFKRKQNVTTIISELDQVFQPTSTAYTFSTREEVKKTINGLNNELDEIRREEHEVGLKLLRAWKKRDESELYGGGTGLWVKRVTS